MQLSTTGPYEPPTPAAPQPAGDLTTTVVRVLSRATDPVLFLGGLLAFLGLLAVGSAELDAYFQVFPVELIPVVRGVGWILAGFGILLSTIAVVLPRRGR